MKILITGAHITPAVAVIGQLKKIANVEVVYVGRKTTLEGDKSLSIESKILPNLGVKFSPIITGRLQRSFTIYTIPSILKIPIGLIQAFYILLSEKPDVILSFGGYVAVPVVFAGWLLSIPIIVHEQTLISGLANKISAAFADKITVSFNQNYPYHKPTVLTGNPLRPEILGSELLKHLDIFNVAGKEKLPVILIMGGNQGSHVINLTVDRVLDKLIKMACIIHVTGDNKFNDFERLDKIKREELGSLENRYMVRKWIGKDLGLMMKKADLVISRAGINTLLELSLMGKPTLVIPIPYQAEQIANAKFFEKLGLARILPQTNLSGKSLLDNIKKMLKSLDKLSDKAKNAKGVIIPDAAKRLALETILLAQHE